ncbi:hypothetical protein [Thermoplasma volcanium GSS1]|uniref:DNA repair protein n=1 Tax=Thermoplasma volcanium (strain ATCC 51530 / DSM 4299 / JCM 9571 / NBRC 15438 / GSS1) TaxID=273116 RepID=Q97C00_THEVO|nr:Nre family DNA repair protein [Thermoplasma volcanium]BAB59447.1 hypothetical protein [Thermoplasma volcanium GSS1]
MINGSDPRYNFNVAPYPYCRLCKGHKHMCGLRVCPILERFQEVFPRLDLHGDISTSTPPSIFIGEYNYPSVYGGIMSVVDPERPYARRDMFDLGMPEIIERNANLFRNVKTVSVHNLSEKTVEQIQEAAMALNELRVESRIVGKEKHFDFFDSPVGPMYKSENIKVYGNAKTPRAAQDVIYDIDLNSTEALKILYMNSIDINYITGLLSGGLLGIEKKRKLVPTRWSITAVDDTISRYLKSDALNYESIDKPMVFSYSRFGNHFNIILLPRGTAFEMQEYWEIGSLWGSDGRVSIDFEFESPRNSYASEITGAYYAARLAVFEYLSRIRRSASAIVLRRISPDYFAPLGVWVIRESVRNALKGKPAIFESLEDLFKVRLEIAEWKRYSPVIKRFMTQKTLTDNY